MLYRKVLQRLDASLHRDPWEICALIQELFVISIHQINEFFVKFG